MDWLGREHRHAGNDAEDLSYPPSGGRIKLIILGVIFPIVLGVIGYRAWISEEALWLGNNGQSLTVRGKAAQAIAFSYAFGATFSHFRWFWGLIPHYLTFRIGTTLSVLGFFVSFLAALYYAFC